MVDIVSVVQSYILKVLEEAGPGMKVMLLDSETTPIVSLAFAQSALMREEVFLFERIQARPGPEDLKHLKCIVIVRPEESLDLLCKELARPRYGSYYLYFTNVVPKSSVKQLAEADMQEVVRDIKEIYIDFYPVGAHLFGLGLPHPLQPLGSRWVEPHLTRSAQAVTSLLLALKLCPAIRECALFNSGSSDSAPTLLILDRREDPVTPLLHQWTYQAMVHELIGINNNRVSLAKAPGVAKDLHDVVLSSSQDEFYAANLYSNFGEIGQTIKQLMDQFQDRARSHQKIESIADMKNFVEDYPQFKKMSGTVSKHVTLVSELSRLVSTRHLLEVSEAEQEIACSGDHSSMLRLATGLVQREDIDIKDAAKLVMLFALRFESVSNNGTRSLQNILRKRGGEQEARLVSNVIRYCGQNTRRGNLFADESNTTKQLTGKLFKGLKGVENVYTQHEPVLRQVLEDCAKGRLTTTTYPYLGSGYEGKPRSIVVFMIGGFTYEEAATVAQLNTSLGVQVVLGGTSLINSSAFMEQVDYAVSGL